MKRAIRIFLILLSGFITNNSLFAHGGEEEASVVRFIENKGQWEEKILFTADLPLGRVFLEADRLTYTFCDVADLHDRYFHRLEEDPFPFPLDCHSFTVRFVGGNLSALKRGDDKEAHYNNYFNGQDVSKWVSKAGVFGTVVYENIYPGIDFVLYGRENSLKYDFWVAPEADPSQIQLEYEGLSDMQMVNAQLQLETSVLTILEDKPFSYQGNAQEIASEYRLSDNVLGFSFPEGWDRTRPLVIDPTMIFSTFTGSAANNFGFTATYDEDGNLFAGGIAYGPGYPTTIGAYQVSFGGGAPGSFDMAITKFSPTGVLIWSTYLGGTQVDQPHSLITNDVGDLYIMGRSNSTDFPVTGNAYDNTHNGAADIVVSKLSANGANLLASTFIGGSLDDALNMTTLYIQTGTKFNYGDDARGEIVLDNSGNVYVAGCTQSQNFPVTPGAVQTQIASQQDGCAFKLNPDLTTLMWSTFLGGTDNDAAYGLKVDAGGNTFVTGGTQSTDFPMVPGGMQPTHAGDIDGFIVRINTSGTAMVNSTFIGTSDYNQCYFLELDRDEDVYVVGQKHGLWTVTPGAWSTPNGGQFIMKLSNDLSSTVYSTQFGTSNGVVNISPTAFLVDVCEFVYVSGWGGTVNFEGTTNNLPLTNDALQSTTDGSDLYIIVLQPDAQGLDFATYVGGPVSAEHVDGGTSRFNKFAEVYQAVCAGCQGNSDFPTTPGAHSTTNGSGFCNLACFKMELQLPGILADFKPDPDSGGCAPQTIYFDNLSSGGNQYYWNFSDPTSGAANTSTLTNPTHTFNNPGLYTVMLVAVDSNSCNVVDTAYKLIRVYEIPLASISPDTSVCLGESLQLSASGGQYYNWTPSSGVSPPTSPTPVVTPTGTTTYTVIVSNPGGCADTAQVIVGVLPVPTAQAGTGGFICPGDSVQLSGTGGQSYIWSPSSSLSNPTSSNPWATPTASTTYTLTVTAANGCTDEDTVTVDVSNVNAVPGPDIDLCIGDNIQLNASGGGSYTWFPPTYLNGTTIPNPVSTPQDTITYYLTVTDAGGCTDTDSLLITVHPLPIVDAGPDEIMCELDSLLLNVTGATTYNWTPVSTLSNPNSASPYAFPTSQTTYIVTGVDVWGCEDEDTIVVDVLPAPIPVAWGETTICADSSVQVFASGGSTYLWSPANLFQDPTLQNPTATLSGTTDLVVTVFASNGCDNRDTVRIDVTPTPVVGAYGGGLVCLGDDITLIALAGGPIVWSTGETKPKISVYTEITEWYSVVSTENGCPSKPDSILVTVDDLLPVAAFFATPDSGWIPLTTTFINQSTGAVSFDWNFQDGYFSNEFSPVHTFADSGRFDVRLIAYNANGCPDTAYQKVIVGADFTIFVPNAFTPNGDGTNDFFNTPWIGVKEFHIMIYDRWGMLIYESFDPDFQWDGVFKGNGCQEGVYTYVIDARGHLSEKVRRAGTVTLLR